jgi:hypothetical protein
MELRKVWVYRRYPGEDIPTKSEVYTCMPDRLKALLLEQSMDWHKSFSIHLIKKWRQYTYHFCWSRWSLYIQNVVYARNVLSVLTDKHISSKWTSHNYIGHLFLCPLNGRLFSISPHRGRGLMRMPISLILDHQGQWQARLHCVISVQTSSDCMRGLGGGGGAKRTITGPGKFKKEKVLNKK